MIWFIVIKTMEIWVKWISNWACDQYDVRKLFSKAMTTLKWDLWAQKVVRLDKIKYFQDYFMKVSTDFCPFDIAPISSGKVYYKEESDELLPSLGYGVICKFGCMWFIHASFSVSIIYIYIYIYWFVQIDFILNCCLWNHPTVT